jgi:hypothetical protein
MSKTPLGDALAVVDRAQAEARDNWSRGADEAELTALRALAEAARAHLAAYREGTPAELPSLPCSGEIVTGQRVDHYSTGADYAAYAAARMNVGNGMDDTEALAAGNVLTLEVHRVLSHRAVFTCVLAGCTGCTDHLDL